MTEATSLENDVELTPADLSLLDEALGWMLLEFADTTNPITRDVARVQEKIARIASVAVSNEKGPAPPREPSQ